MVISKVTGGVTTDLARNEASSSSSTGAQKPATGRIAQLKSAVESLTSGLTSKLRSNVGNPSLKSVASHFKLGSVETSASPSSPRLSPDDCAPQDLRELRGSRANAHADVSSDSSELSPEDCAPQNLRELINPKIKSDSQLNQKAKATSQKHQQAIQRSNVKADTAQDFRPATRGQGLDSISE